MQTFFSNFCLKQDKSQAYCKTTLTTCKLFSTQVREFKKLDVIPFEYLLVVLPSRRLNQRPTLKIPRNTNSQMHFLDMDNLIFFISKAD